MNKFYKVVDKIGKYNFILIIFIFISLLTTSIYQTFSLYTEGLGVSIIDGIKTYSFILDANNDTNSVIIKAGSSKNIDITVANDSEAKLLYGLYYSSTDDIEYVNIGYLSRSVFLPNDVIDANSSCIVTIRIDNYSDEEVIINLGLKYGFEKGGELVLNDNQKWIGEYFDVKDSIKKQIRVTGINVDDTTDGVISKGEKYYINKLMTSFILPNSTSTITYRIEITNFGIQEMGIYEITGLPDYLTYELSNYELKDKICDEDGKCNSGIVKDDILLTIKYSDQTINPSIINHNISLDLKFKNMYVVTYNGITNDGYPTSIIEGDTLKINFGKYAPSGIKIYNNGVEANDYIYSNGILNDYVMENNIEIVNYPTPEKPVIDNEGLIPVVISDNGDVTTISATNSNWYDYANKKWANAILVSNSSRSKYLGTTGVSVSLSDILAYYVWIPRYKYKIWAVGNGWHTEHSIEIDFELKSNAMLLGNTVDSWRTMPAFWWDDNSNGVVEDNETVAGIWVSKFEVSGSSTSPKILPNAYPLNSQIISSQFVSSIIFSGGSLFNGIVTFSGSSTYGLSKNTDSHLMKNVEWAAVAYLSHSKYGIDREIRRNRFLSNRSKTGCGLISDDELNEQTSSSVCEDAYGTVTDYFQSTSGNITGIFDMSGGGRDMLMAVLADSNGKPRSGNTTSINSGFNGSLVSGSMTTGVDFPQSKYYDLYTSTTISKACNNANCYGHALYETDYWFEDNNEFFEESKPWIYRGAIYNSGRHAGIFSRLKYAGEANWFGSFHSVLVVK